VPTSQKPRLIRARGHFLNALSLRGDDDEFGERRRKRHGLIVLDQSCNMQLDRFVHPPLGLFAGGPGRDAPWKVRGYAEKLSPACSMTMRNRRTSRQPSASMSAIASRTFGILRILASAPRPGATVRGHDLPDSLGPAREHGRPDQKAGADTVRRAVEAPMGWIATNARNAQKSRSPRFGNVK